MFILIDILMDYLINEHLNLDKKNLFFFERGKKNQKKLKNLIKKPIFLKIKKKKFKYPVH